MNGELTEREREILDMWPKFEDGEPDGSIPTWHVYCGQCGATGPEVLLKRGNAVSAWNRRAGERDE